MTWTNFWIVIGIVYSLYYAVIIAYDLYQINKKEKKVAQNIYDVNDLFEAEKPKIVEFKNLVPIPIVGKSNIFLENTLSKVEDQGLTTTQMMDLVKKKGRISMDKANDIFG
jgi:hypothetical protein